jgi:hypothetical protein
VTSRGLRPGDGVGLPASTQRAEMAEMTKRHYIKAICANCGKEFDARLDDVKRGYGKYCSLSCSTSASYKPRIQGGAKNPNWKNGISKNHYHYKKIQKERYPKRIKARQMITDAIRRGKIKKLPCLICGDPNTEAHHPDYDKPLEIVWLCEKHHREISNPALGPPKDPIRSRASPRYGDKGTGIRGQHVSRWLANVEPSQQVMDVACFSTGK